MITYLIRKFDKWFLDGIEFGRIDDYIYAWIEIDSFDSSYQQWIRISIKDMGNIQVNAKTWEASIR